MKQVAMVNWCLYGHVHIQWMKPVLAWAYCCILHHFLPHAFGVLHQAAFKGNLTGIHYVFFENAFSLITLRQIKNKNCYFNRMKMGLKGCKHDCILNKNKIRLQQQTIMHE